MNLAKVLLAPARAAKAFNRMIFSRSSGLMWRIIPNSRFDYAGAVGDRMGSSTIMAPVLWIARTFPEAPVIVEQLKGQEREVVPGHAMTKLLRRPNPYYSGKVMWMATVISFVIDGNAYWLKVRNSMGGVEELWYVPHWMLTPKGSEQELITHYEYLVDGKIVKLDNADVVHFRFGLDPHNPQKGMSPLASVLREVFTDDEAANFSAALLKNLGVPGLVVSPDSDASPSADDVKATKEYVEQEFGGDNRGKPLVMSGRTKVQSFGFSPKDMTLKDLRRIPEERVTAVIGIPAIVAGLGAGLDRSTFANMSEAREMAYESNIIPTQGLMSEELNHQLLSDFEDKPENFETSFDTSKVRVLQEDGDKLAARWDTMVKGGWAKVSEARRAMGLEVDSSHELYLRPFNLIEVPAGAAPRDPEKGLKGRKSAQSDVAELMRALQRDSLMLEDRFADDLQGAFDDLGKLCAAAYERIGPKALSTNGTKAVEEETLVSSIMAGARVGTFAEEKLRPLFETHVRRVANRTTDIITAMLDLEVSIPDPAMRQVIAQGGTRAGLVDVASDTRAAILRAIEAGRAAGEGPAVVARRIAQDVPAGRFLNAGSRYRSLLISRTETRWAQNVSSIEAYRASDSIGALVAFDAQGGDSDPDCEARNGQIFSFDDAEAELADEHPNGTLSFGPVMAQTADV